MTFYKFAERDASTQVNWAELSKKMSDTFLEEQRVREEKKAAIDKATSDYATTLEQQPLSENVSMKEFWLKASEDLREAKLMSTRLLKEGKMKLTDYTVFSQNLQDGTNNFIDAMKRYNEEYKIKRERLMSQDPANASQLLEAWEMEQLQGLTDLANTKVYIDPTTGAMTMAKMTKKVVDGKEVMTMSDERVSANQIMNMLGSKYNKFDLNGALAQEEKMLGKYTDVLTQALSTGVNITEYENPASRGNLDEGLKESLNDFYSYRDNMVESYMSNPLNVSSILTDYTNKGYSFTDDPNNNDPMKILVKKTSSGLVPIFEGEKGEQQLKVASDYVKNKFMNMVDVVEKSRGVSKPATPKNANGETRASLEKKRTYDNYYQQIANLYSGEDKSKISTSISLFEGMRRKEDLRIERTDSGVTLSYGDGSPSKVFKFSDYPDEKTFVENVFTRLVEPSMYNGMSSSISRKGVTPTLETFIDQTIGGQADNRSIGQKTVAALSEVPYTNSQGNRLIEKKDDYTAAMNDALSFLATEGNLPIKVKSASGVYGSVKLVDASGKELYDGKLYEVTGDDVANAKKAHQQLLKDISSYLDSLETRQKAKMNLQWSNSQYNKTPTE